MRNFGADMWLAIGLGLMAGLATLWTFGRWVRFIGGLRQDSVQVGGRQKPRYRIMGMPLLGFAQPTPWLVIIGLPCSAYYFVHVRQSQSGAWFFGTIGAVVVCWLVGEAVLRLNIQKKRRSGSPNL
jgi:hypothetical protein